MPLQASFINFNLRISGIFGIHALNFLNCLLIDLSMIIIAMDYRLNINLLDGELKRDTLIL